MLKALAALVLKEELAALKSRLAEASTALNSIEAEAVKVGDDAATDVKALAQKVVADVLAAADEVRAKAGPFASQWEKDLQADYNAGVVDVKSAYTKAAALISKTALFFKSKL